MAGLTLRGVVRRHGERPAVDRVDLDVPDGELLAIVGPSGSGKTTLLRLIAGLDPLDEGEIALGERTVAGPGIAVAPAERDVAMVFQSFALFPHLSVADNIGFGMSARGARADERAEAVQAAAGRLGLDDVLDRTPDRLSGGERQRVALARALVRRPAALLLDEPLSNLDAQLRHETRAQLRRLHDEEGLTMIHVTHDQSEALSLGDRVAILRDGRLEQVGTPEAVYARPATAWAAAFLGTPPMNLIPAAVRGGTVGSGALRVPAPPGAPDGPATLGVRPEHVKPDPAGSLHATLERAEAAGHERLWHLRIGDLKLVARVEAGRTEPAGSEVVLAVDPADVRLFDPETGAAR